MEKDELLKRIVDLADQCERNQHFTTTHFMTPSESFFVENWASNYDSDINVVLTGGYPNSERKIAFFLPYYIDPEHFDYSEYIKCLKIESKYHTLGHRDYMGALLNLGIKRQWIGDICVIENSAIVMCSPTIVNTIINNLSIVGKTGVEVMEISLDSIPEIKHNFKHIQFTVMSLRLDSIVGGMFKQSRSDAAKNINLGKVCLNYEEALHVDKSVKLNDIISLRGSGKGKIVSIGGTTRKGRIIVDAELYG